MNPLELDAVVISHFHPDHVFDLVPLRYLCAFAPGRAQALDVLIHPGASERLRRLAAAAATRDEERFFQKAFEFREYSPGTNLRIGDLSFAFTRTVHYIDAYAMRVSSAGAAVAYSADTAPSQAVVRLAKDADLFICECSLGAAGSDREPRGHCNAAEAGRMAREAGVKQLLLTHYGAQFAADDLAAAAAREFDGRITVAEDGTQLSVFAAPRGSEN